MAKYHVFCNYYRGGKLMWKHDQCTPEPWECDEDSFIREEALMYAQSCLEKQFEKREAEDMISVTNIEGDTNDDYLQFDFVEPEYNTTITEIFCNFQIGKEVKVEKNIPLGHSFAINDDGTEGEEVCDFTQKVPYVEYLDIDTGEILWSYQGV